MIELNTQPNLEKHYENKYKSGGYSGEIINGINISLLFHKRRHDVTLSLAPPQKTDIVLDAGCGAGMLTRRLSKTANQVYGIDITASAFENTPADSNVSYLKMNMENLDFPNNYFDKIYAVETLEHILNPKTALKEFHRTLKQNGELIICYPTINENFIGRLEKKLSIHDNIDISEHLNEFNYEQLVQLVNSKGFDLIQSKGIGFNYGSFINRTRNFNKLLTLTITYAQILNSSSIRNSYNVLLQTRKQI